MGIKYVIYTHTDYLDVLEIQTEYLKDYDNKILLINKNSIDSDLYSKYKDVIYYDDSLPYASRLLSLKELDDEYILLIHDTDIIISKDDSFVSSVLSTMESMSLDRVDFQWKDYDFQGEDTNPNTERIKVGDVYLSKQENTKSYIYNVQPSIWKLSTLMDIMTEFKDVGYRSIEEVSQEYCVKFKIYKLSTNTHIDIGYNQCTEYYQFFHITRGGRWFPLEGNDRRINRRLSEIYDRIVDKYNLLDSEREFIPKFKGHPFFHKPFMNRV